MTGSEAIGIQGAQYIASHQSVRNLPKGKSFSEAMADPLPVEVIEIEWLRPDG